MTVIRILPHCWCFNSETSLIFLRRFSFSLLLLLGIIWFRSHINYNPYLLFTNVSPELFDQILSFLLYLWHIIEHSWYVIFIRTVVSSCAHSRRRYRDPSTLLSLFLSRLGEVRVGVWMMTLLVNVFQSLQTSLASTLGQPWSETGSIFWVKTYSRRHMASCAIKLENLGCIVLKGCLHT